MRDLTSRPARLRRALRRHARAAHHLSTRGPRRTVWLLLLATGLTTATVASIPSRDGPAVNHVSGRIAAPPAVVATGDTVGGPAPAPAAVMGEEPAADTPPWQHLTVHRGDTLLAMLHREGLGTEGLAGFLQTQARTEALSHLTPGQTIRVRATPDGALQALTVDLDEARMLRLERDAGGYRLSRPTRETETRLAYVTGTIDSSLFAAGQEAGLSDALIMALAEIFGWDVDFALDLRRGDRFAVIHETRYAEGRKIADGPIMAAEFVNRGKAYRAIGYRDDRGRLRYYTPDGLSVRRPFLRTPVKFSRISSGFTNHRFHPVLKTWRAHTGVDYAAPTGTPVRATADGRVAFVGRKGGYGKVVILQHGGAYSTVYGHLSGYSPAARTGGRVEQGQIIGYVGRTGLASGPHLHYEFRVNGVHRNPLTFRMPAARPIPPAYLPDFVQTARAWTARLDIIDGRTPLASSGAPE